LDWPKLKELTSKWYSGPCL